MPSVPMRVDWTAVSEEDDRQQPVNHAVLRQVARMPAQAARLQALDANRRGHFSSAREALPAVAEQIAQLDPDDREIRCVTADLRMEEDAFLAAD